MSEATPGTCGILLRGALALVLLGSLFWGCSPGAGREPFPPALLEATASSTLPADRARELLVRARQYERDTGNFSALVRLDLHDLRRGEVFSARGAIALRRPASLRMQVTGPGGVTAVDLLALGERYWLRLAGRDWQRGALDELPAQGFPAGSVARTLLSLDWDHAVVLRDGALALARLPAPGGFALVTFETGDGATREVRWFSHGVEHARARFVAFEPEHNGRRFPRVVLFWQKEPSVSATITVEQRTLFPSLPERTFAAPE